MGNTEDKEILTENTTEEEIIVSKRDSGNGPLVDINDERKQYIYLRDMFNSIDYNVEFPRIRRNYDKKFKDAQKAFEAEKMGIGRIREEERKILETPKEEYIAETIMKFRNERGIYSIENGNETFAIIRQKLGIEELLVQGVAQYPNELVMLKDLSNITIDLMDTTFSRSTLVYLSSLVKRFNFTIVDTTPMYVKPSLVLKDGILTEDKTPVRQREEYFKELKYKIRKHRNRFNITDFFTFNADKTEASFSRENAERLIALVTKLNKQHKVIPVFNLDGIGLLDLKSKIFFTRVLMSKMKLISAINVELNNVEVGTYLAPIISNLYYGSFIVDERMKEFKQNHKVGDHIIYSPRKNVFLIAEIIENPEYIDGEVLGEFGAEEIIEGGEAYEVYSTHTFKIRLKYNIDGTPLHEKQVKNILITRSFLVNGYATILPVSMLENAKNFPCSYNPTLIMDKDEKYIDERLFNRDKHTPNLDKDFKINYMIKDKLNNTTPQDLMRHILKEEHKKNIGEELIVPSIEDVISGKYVPPVDLDIYK